MSARWDHRELLQPITPDHPCGESLEDTQLLASFDAFRLFGQPLPTDPPPEWNVIRTQALEALGKSKDLRLLAYLGSAVLRTDGLQAFTDTLSIASQWLHTYWNQTYPLVDEDAILRRNALNCFADPMVVIDGLRRLPLVSSRAHGTFCLRDFEVASGQVPPRDGTPAPDEERIKAAFAEMPVDELKRLHDSAVGGRSAVRAIDATMREAAGSDATPSFDLLSAQLEKMERVLRAQVDGREDGTSAASLESGAAPLQAGRVGPINSRQDSINALEAVADFFRRTEPSSPIPLLLERAKRLVSKDFLEVLADIAPDGVAQARAAGGLRLGE
jgi:type VI secretion system protein ImpA